MREEHFLNTDAGRLVKIKEGGHAFVPAPLPPANIVYSPLLIRILSDAEAELGRLEGLGRMLPNPDILIQPFLRREAVLSSKIEGTHTSFSDLLLFEAATKINDRRDRSAQEVANYVIALDYGLRRCHAGNRLDRKIFSEMHEHLLGGDDTEQPVGQFRTHQVHVGRGSAIKSARYVPPPPQYIEALVSNLEDFIALETELPLLIKLALIHYQFEAIHPFGDGNGRIGRLLITLMLCTEGRLRYPLLYLSAFFERFRDEYYALLLGVSQKNDWNSWLMFFLHAVRSEARDAQNRTSKLFDLQRAYKEAFSGSRGSTGPLALIDKLIESPILTIAVAQQFLGVSYPSAKQVVNKLVERKILKPLKYGARTTYFVASEIIDVIEQSQTIEEEEFPEALPSKAAS